MGRYAVAGRLTLAMLLAMAVTACSSAYREARMLPFMNLAGGYQEENAVGGLIKVTYKGNESILMYQVENYALYRCAEIARREGRPYFALYQGLSDALQDRRSDKVKATTLLGIPHAEVYISLRRSAEPGLLSSSEVLASLSPSIAAGGK